MVDVTARAINDRPYDIDGSQVSVFIRLCGGELREALGKVKPA